MKRLLMGMLLIFISCGGALANNSIAIVKLTQGEVSAKRQGTTFSLKPGANLKAGDILITGSRSRIGIIFNDGSVLTLEEKSFLRIREFVFKPVTKDFKFNLFLKHGTGLFESGKIGKLAPQDFKFEIPDGVIGIRGTKFLVEVK